MLRDGRRRVALARYASDGPGRARDVARLAALDGFSGAGSASGAGAAGVRDASSSPTMPRRAPARMTIAKIVPITIFVLSPIAVFETKYSSDS